MKSGCLARAELIVVPITEKIVRNSFINIENPDEFFW